jgi:hypothetical protein
LIASNAQEVLCRNDEEAWVGGRGIFRVLAREEGPVEIAVPPTVQARAEEIVRLSQQLGQRGAGFSSPREVLAPALVYGLAHMQERYRQAAVREEGEAVGR